MDFAASFRNFAEWCDGTSPLYARLARTVADDEDLLALAADVPEGKSPPHLLLAGVHYLLLAGADHPLAAYYPTCTDDPRAPDGDLPERFREFCLAHADDLRAIFRRRRTQTNAVRRTAVLYPAFAHVAARVGEPIAPVEVGPSAGLLVLWDRYGYEYRREDGRPVARVGAGAGTIGGSASGGDEFGAVGGSASGGDETGAATGGESDAVPRPTITPTVRGAARPPLPGSPPPVADRVGVDRHPLDPTDPDDARWLRALVWPEHDRRHALLSDALAVARAHPPDVREGDAVELLPALVDELPDDATPVVYGTQVLYQLSPDQRREFRDRLREIGRDRPLQWLSGERGVDRDENAIRLAWSRVDGDGIATTRIADYQQHGEWVRWYGGTPG